MSYKIIPYGSSALLIQFENNISTEIHQQVTSLYHTLLSQKIKGILSLIPAYNSITVRYNQETNFNTLSNTITNISKNLKSSPNETPKKEIVIPVCYDISLGIDIEHVMNHIRLSRQEMIELHTSTSYPVYMIGFTPGFPYLGGLDKRLHTPRKVIPRLKVPKGAVGLANNQTGIYPNESPGGWQIIGQTPISLFTVEELPLVNIGDTIRFEAISLEQFNELKNEN